MQLAGQQSNQTVNHSDQRDSQHDDAGSNARAAGWWPSRWRCAKISGELHGAIVARASDFRPWSVQWSLGDACSYCRGSKELPHKNFPP